METATHQSDEDILIQGLKTWLHRIVANRAKNHLRKHKREVSADFSETLDPELANRFRPNGRWATPPSLRFEDAESLMENGRLPGPTSCQASGNTTIRPDTVRSPPA